MILQPPFETERLELNKFLYDLYEKLGIVPNFRTTQTATDYSALKNDYYIGVTDTAAPRTITLPDLDSVPEWIQYIVKDESGGAGANNITVDGSGIETIDGAANQVISTNYGVLRLRRNSTQWLLW